MKKEIICLLVAFVYTLTTKANTNPQLPKTFNSQQNTGLSFTENKGQVYDQNYKPRPDVLYGVMAGNMAVHIKKTGLSYQLYRVDSYREIEDPKTRTLRKEIDQQTIYRIDLNWLNFNKNFSTTEDKALSGYNNYYLESCPNGALNVKSYKGVTINNLYKGINLHYYEKNGELKHDYIVAPHTDYKQIELKIDGAEITVRDDGSLILNTPLGKIQEGAPIVYQNGKQLKARWKTINNILSFEIDNYNQDYELLIDPVTRLWGTYYGGSADDEAQFCTSDLLGNIYITGYTGSNTGTVIATTGSHQSAFGASVDAFLVKFTTSGTRIWGTYYGGTGFQIGYSCASDAASNIFMSGSTTSSSGTVISTSGCHQPLYGGGSDDAFIVKFNSSGVRQWSTYYGGSNNDISYGCASNATGDVYMAGYSNSNNTNVIATSASHQSLLGGSYDAFLVKFNSNGVRQWGTYYGGVGLDNGFYCNVDGTGNVLMAGLTYSSSNGIASLGSHQPNYGGGNDDGFLVKFNSSGVRQWGTYYGGTGDDFGYSCTSDVNANVFLVGSTTSNSGTVIATSGSHQSANGGGANDAFIAKFDANGVRQWGTYYGGTGDDQGYSSYCDVNGNFYLAGYTDSNTGTVIATSGSHQSTNNGGTYDCLLVKFSNAGIRQWGTYYGGSGKDRTYSCVADNSGSLYLAGSTDSNTGTAIATSGSHQSTYGGSTYDGFLVKFDICETSPTQPLAIAGNTVMCAASAASIYSTATVSGANSYSWSLPAGWSGSSNSNTISAAPGSSGIISLIAANSCGSSPQQTLNVTVNSLPSLTISTTNNTLCIGETATISASGASSYTFNPGGAASSITITPIINTTYTLTGIDANGCSNTANFTQNVDACTSINTELKNQDSRFKVYPNPSKGSVNIELESEAQVIIMNALGQVVYSDKFKAGLNQINLEGLDEGVYAMRVFNNVGSKNIKLIKE